jgi:uncharacterized domain HDIG
MISEATAADYTTALLFALEAKSPGTGAHCNRVSKYALEIGRQMELSSAQLSNLKFGAMLHDVGKLRTPDHVLEKPGRLDPEELAAMRRHPTEGAGILHALGFSFDLVSIVHTHHESYDGSGYPCGLAGDDISIETRIISVADTYDAITCDRCYRKGAPNAIARHEIESWSGKQFDPDVVDAFLNCHTFKNLAAA